MISPGNLYGVAIRGLILYSYIIIIIYMLLLRSGNVELNPGPVNCKSCPKCLNETVAIKLKVCTCGYVFHKKTYREPPKCRSIPLTTVTSNIMTDIDDVQLHRLFSHSLNLCHLMWLLTLIQLMIQSPLFLDRNLQLKR